MIRKLNYFLSEWQKVSIIVNKEIESLLKSIHLRSILK